MELAVTENKEQKGKGRVGTLENPESYENVPGHIIPIIEREFDDFDNEAEEFLAERLPENEFIGFRLKQGVYGQRQPDVQMVRVKLPFGGVTPEQMDAFAEVVEKYAPLNKGHITTRQNIQIHHVPLRDMESLIREISTAGLSSREGCGNTMRNVTGDPWAGVAADEVFDPTPYAGAYIRYFVRHPTTQLMPRKIKTAFTGSDEDRAISRHPRHRLPRPRTGRGQGLRDPGRRRHLDHGPRRADPLRLRRGRQRRLPQGRRGGAADLRPPGLAARQPRPRPDQGAGRQDRRSTPSASRSRRSCGATGSPSASSTPIWSSGCASTTTRRPRRRRSRPRPPPRTATGPSSSASSRATSRPSARRASPRSR